MIAAGGAAGVAAAFGSPIGGALFAYEISKPNTFWTFEMLWRVFVATSSAVVTVSVLTAFEKASPLGLIDGSILKFGTLEMEASSMYDFPSAVVIGVVSGLIGSAFVWVNSNLGIYRKKLVNANWKKVSEAVLFAALTSIFFFAGPLITASNCKVLEED